MAFSSRRIAAGVLDTLVAIKQRDAGEDALGQPVQTWTTVASVWAQIRYPAAGQTQRADALTSIAQVVVRVRQRADITAAMRVMRSTGETFEIKGVRPAPGSVFMDLDCEVVQ